MGHARARAERRWGTVIGQALGDDLSQITLGAFDTLAEGGPVADVVAASFRRVRLQAGVSVERYTEPPEADTPFETPATPLIADPAQERLTGELAAWLDTRVSDMLAGACARRHRPGPARTGAAA